MMTDHEQIMISALRYALGRRSYIVGDTKRYISRYIPEMSQHCKNVMIDDIKNQKLFGYGDECDKADWMNLLDELRGDEECQEE